jgi:hypothetical protein
MPSPAKLNGLDPAFFLRIVLATITEQRECHRGQYAGGFFQATPKELRSTG